MESGLWNDTGASRKRVERGWQKKKARRMSAPDAYWFRQGWRDFLRWSEVFKSKCAVGISLWNAARRWLLLRNKKASQRSGMKQANEKRTLAYIYNGLRCEVVKRSWGTKRSGTNEHGNVHIFENETKLAKNVTSRLARATSRRAKQSVAVAPFIKWMSGANTLLGLQGARVATGEDWVSVWNKTNSHATMSTYRSARVDVDVDVVFVKGG